MVFSFTILRIVVIKINYLHLVRRLIRFECTTYLHTTRYVEPVTTWHTTVPSFPDGKSISCTNNFNCHLKLFIIRWEKADRGCNTIIRLYYEYSTNCVQNIDNTDHMRLLTANVSRVHFFASINCQCLTEIDVFKRRHVFNHCLWSILI